MHEMEEDCSSKTKLLTSNMSRTAVITTKPAEMDSRSMIGRPDSGLKTESQK